MPGRLEELLRITRKHRLFLVEDAAQAHLAKYKEKMAGTFGDIATFSFFPGKNLGAYGDAGAIVTNNDELDKKCRMFSNHGRAEDEKYTHTIEGYNSRLDALQAAILSVKLTYLQSWTVRRRAIAARYGRQLGGVSGVVTPRMFNERSSAYHLYVIRTKERDKLRKFLNARGIDTGVHYPVALPFLGAYQALRHRASDFPVSAKLAQEIVSLPIFPELGATEQKYIVESIKEFFAKSAGGQ
jgi:dTDP-4-amino-4,6-dideoxygalactose transaminase